MGDTSGRRHLERRHTKRCLCCQVGHSLRGVDFATCLEDGQRRVLQEWDLSAVAAVLSNLEAKFHRSSVTQL